MNFNILFSIFLTLAQLPSFGQTFSIFKPDLPSETIRENQIKSIEATNDTGTLIYKEHYNRSGVLIKSELSNGPIQYFLYSPDEQPFEFDSTQLKRHVIHSNFNGIEEKRVMDRDGSLIERTKITLNVKGQAIRKERYGQDNALKAYINYEYDEMGRPITQSTYESNGKELSKLVIEYDSSGRSTTYLVNESGKLLREKKEIIEHAHGGETEYHTIYEPALNIKIEHIIEKNEFGDVVRMSIDNNDGKPRIETITQMTQKKKPRLEKITSFQADTIISEMVFNYLPNKDKENLVRNIIKVHYKDGQANENQIFHRFNYEFY